MSNYLNPEGYLLYAFPFIISLIIVLFLFIFIRFRHIWFLNQSILVGNNKIIFFIFFTLFCTIEYWIFGNSSYVRVYDEIDTIFPILKRIGENSIYDFGHDISGGIHIANIWHTISIFNINVLFIKLFDPYIAYLISKILITFIGIYGGYLLLNTVINNFIYSIFGSAIIFYSNFFSNTVSVFNGIGYASIPLSIYLCFILNVNERIRILILIIYSAILISWSSFPHTYMPQIISIFVFGIFYLSLEKIHIKTLYSTAFFILLVSILYLGNNYPFINFLTTNTEELARVYFKVNQENYFDSFFEIFHFIKSKFSLGYLWYYIILIITINYLIYKKYIKLILINSLFFIIIFIYLIVDLIEPLNFLSGIRFETILFALPTIVIFFSFDLIKDYDFKYYKHFKDKFIFTFLFFIFISSIFYIKYDHVITWIGEGSYRSNLILESNFEEKLIENNIISKNNSFENNFRSISIWHYLTPGFLWYNNINSFDGISGFFSKDRALRWIDNSKTGKEFIKNGQHQLGNGNKFRCYDKVLISDNINIEFLKKNSVKYIISKIKLNDQELNLIYEPKNKYFCKNFIDEKYKNIFKNFEKIDAYIYEISDSKKIFEIITEQECLLNENNLKRINNGWEFNLMDCEIENNLIFFKANLPNYKKFVLFDKNNNIKKVYNKNLDEIYQIKSKNFNIIPIYK